MMRTAQLFLIIGLTVCTFCKAQDIPVLPQEKFRHHEFSVSYGFLPITDANSMAEECFAPVLSFGVYTREKTNYYGALNISYIYRFNRKISLGVTGGITGNKGTASSLYEALDEKTTEGICMFFPPSGGTGLPAPNSLCIPQQGSVPISFGTVLEEKSFTRQDSLINSVF